MNQRIPYSEYEDKLIADLVKMHTGNKQYAFSLASEMINRSVRGIGQRYYGKIQKGDEQLFELKSDKKATKKNYKNTRRPETESSVKTDMHFTALEMMSIAWGKLSKEEKLNFFKSIL
jgi:hypothetical protein